ncbi:MAG: (Fe-S)-binding protein [Synergistaceae bacterium]|nr:(Fe-S)-binding protein [Synergistaceae bacterium]
MNVNKIFIRLDQFLASSSLLRRNTGESESGIIFFPGCSLMGYNPGYIFMIQDYLSRRLDSQIGILTACCSKPLKLLNESKTFTRHHELLKRDLDSMKAKRVITACQNCYRVLRDYQHEREIISLWPLMLGLGLNDDLKGKYSGLEASVQDSCSGTQEIANSVREMLKYMGVKIHEFKKRFKCCGGIQAITTGSKQAMKERANESPCELIISYCASCRSAMSIDNQHKSIHILDLIFGNAEISQKNFNLLNRFITAKNLHKE